MKSGREPVRVEEEDTSVSIHQNVRTAVSEEGSLGGPSYLNLNQSMVSLTLHNSRNLSPVNEEQLLPPINRTVLQELDFSRVESNVQIMHDLYLEPDLRIQPNRKKRSDLADTLYWVSIQQDLQSLQASIGKGQRGQCPTRLFTLLKELKAIMGEIHPESERVQMELEDYFDLDILVADLECGQFDFTHFGNRFTDLIQTNCAPKRDKLVVDLRKCIIQGEFTDFLRQSLSLLELMKLDIVNYHLAKLRPEMHYKLVALEKQYWSKVEDDLEDTKTWLEITMDLMKEQPRGENKAFSVFSQGIVDLVIGTDEDLENLPETFLFDEVRMRKMRTEAQDICIVALVLNVQRHFLGAKTEGAELKKSLFTLLQKEQAEVEEITKLLLTSIEKVKGKASLSLEPVINGMLSSIVRPDGNLFIMMEDRLAKFMLDSLWKRKTLILGFEGVSGEVKDFVGRFVLMGLTNWVVHRETYARLLA